MAGTQKPLSHAMTQQFQTLILIIKFSYEGCWLRRPMQEIRW